MYEVVRQIRHFATQNILFHQMLDPVLHKSMVLCHYMITNTNVTAWLKHYFNQGAYIIALI